jgi:flagellar FliJ protein
MSFRFSLQKIVDLKGNQKTQAEWLLSEALGILRDEQLSLTELHDEQKVQQERLQAAAEQPTPIVQLQLLQDYSLHLERLIERKLADVSSAQQRVNGKQQLLMERSLDEKVWMKAREKAYLAHTALELKKEQDMLDEITSARFGFQ